MICFFDCTTTFVIENLRLIKVTNRKSKITGKVVFLLMTIDRVLPNDDF